ncbi:MAG: hypothetical protein KatS3mg118_2477 [Paracoccaceae bacterium]|nr:MAG: hypothetical protein KatS3mg118_2477 [Paracoccaceae bacterium]
MIGALRAFRDSLFGIGEAAVTVPPLDGALRPNAALDAAGWRRALAGVDCLAAPAGGPVAAAGRMLHRLDKEEWHPWRECPAEIAAITPLGADGLAVALVTGEISVQGGPLDGLRLGPLPGLRCITDMAAGADALFVANGSDRHGPREWSRDLMERNAGGSLWRIDLPGGRARALAGGLAYPAGVVIAGAGVLVSEAWRHRLVLVDPDGAGAPRVVLSDLPAYPGRLSPGSAGYWLAAFAPRLQLVEFVLREPAYRRRMIAEVPPPYWIAPSLRAGRSFREPLQGGAVKHLGMVKPWAPSFSAGLVVGLDRDFQPRCSLHSRADGSVHGVTSVIEHRGRIFAAARGDGVVVATALDGQGDRG